MFLDHEISALSDDADRWQSYVDTLQKSFLLSMMRDGRNEGPQWSELSLTDKESIVLGIARLHESTFHYNTLPVSVSEADDIYASNGFYVAIPERNASDNTDGGITLPETLSATAALQLLTYGLAKNVLVGSVVHDVDKGGNKRSHASSSDMYMFDVQSTLLHKEKTKAFFFPMPDQFDQWLELDSNKYALQAARGVSRQCLGTDEIDPRVYETLQPGFMEHQYHLLSMALETDNTLAIDEDGYREQWVKRARLYVEEAFRDPQKYSSQEKENATEIMLSLFKIAPDVVLADHVKDAVINHPNLNILLLSKREEALSYIGGANSLALQSLQVNEQAHLLSALGAQESLDDEMHKRCDDAAFKLLSAQRLDPQFRQYCFDVMQDIHASVDADPIMAEIEQRWADDLPMADKFYYATRLCDHAAKHFGIENVPKIYTFTEQTIKDARHARGSNGFATRRAHAKSIKKEYHIDVPEGVRMIGLNANKERSPFTAPTPSDSARVVIHEVVHHAHYEFSSLLLNRKLQESDPRYRQTNTLMQWSKASEVIDRLRDEFSLRVYPHIPDEVFSYTCDALYILKPPSP